MAGPSAADSTAKPSSDAPAIAHVDWWYGRLEEGLNLIAAASIFVLMLAGMVQIIAPRLFDVQIQGYIDWIEFTAVLYAFGGIAYCQRKGSHIRMEIILGQFRGRMLWINEALASAIGIGITLLMIWTTWQNFDRAWSIGDSSMDIRLPLWPAKLVVPIMLGSLVIRLAIQFWGQIRLAIDPSRTPLAVPMVEDTAKAAQREIEEGMRALELDQRRRAGGG